MSQAGKTAGKPKPASKPAAKPAAKPAGKPKAGGKPKGAKGATSVAAAGKPKGGVAKPKVKRIAHTKRPIFEKRARNFGIGGNVQPTRDLTRFVRWPKYIRLQRQKSILLKRLKVPGTINQFSRTADRNTAAQLFTFLDKYRPETRKHKDKRLRAAAKVDAKAITGKGKKIVAVAKPKKAYRPKCVKYGLHNVTTLVERKKAALVIIAHDVDPLELVLWLPTLCRKKDIPYIIVKGKARLGKVVHKKTAAVLAITAVNEPDKKQLENLVQKARDNFLSRYSEHVRVSGGQLMGSKHSAAAKKEEKKRTAAAKN
jgi:large subunit ribosomal protein L7Ae